MFGNVVHGPGARFSERLHPHREKPGREKTRLAKPARIVLTDDEQSEVYTDLASLLSMPEQDPKDG